MLRIVLPVEVAAQPACSFRVLGVASGPDVCGSEVRAVGIRIPKGLDDLDDVFVKQCLHAGELRMQAELAVEVEHIFTGLAEGWAVLVVKGVGVRDDGIEPVVATCELDQDKHVV